LDGSLGERMPEEVGFTKTRRPLAHCCHSL